MVTTRTSLLLSFVSFDLNFKMTVGARRQCRWLDWLASEASSVTEVTPTNSGGAQNFERRIRTDLGMQYWRGCHFEALSKRERQAIIWREPTTVNQKHF